MDHADGRRDKMVAKGGSDRIAAPTQSFGRFLAMVETPQVRPLPFGMVDQQDIGPLCLEPSDGKRHTLARKQGGTVALTRNSTRGRLRPIKTNDKKPEGQARQPGRRLGGARKFVRASEPRSAIAQSGQKENGPDLRYRVVPGNFEVQVEGAERVKVHVTAKGPLDQVGGDHQGGAGGFERPERTLAG